jgi:DNA-binding Lrp family transcriptional regulator
MSDFTMDELLALLEKECGVLAAGLSVREIAQRLGRSEAWVAARLRALHERGAVRVGYRRSWRIDGRPCLTPVYAIREGEKENGENTVAGS